LDISKHRQIVLILNRSEASISLICDNVLVKKVVHSDFGNIALNTLSEPLSLSHFEVNEKAISRHFFNYALTPAEVSLLWNRGRPDKAKLKFYQKWGSNTNLKPSQFKKGKVYKITNNTGSNFTLYGASNNEIGTVFTCNNDFNITNNNGYAIQLGCVASYTSKGLVYNSSLQVNRWLDDSSNKLHADVSGDPLV
jgi:hypothetical protein